MLKRLVYTGYYLKQMNWAQLTKFMNFVRDQNHFNKSQLWILMFFNSLRYNISLLEYYQFGFYNIKSEDKKYWAGTGYMYEYQKKMNPPDKRSILDDKRQFLKAYHQFVIHKNFDINEIQKNKSLINQLLDNPAGKIVFKASDGKCGAQVEVKSAADFNSDNIALWMHEHGYDLVEEFIIQHPDLDQLSPSAVNTVRIFTQLNDDNDVEILGCRLRISVNSKVDNMAAGNLAATINEETGIVDGPGVYSDITKPDETIHPVTGVPIAGFQVPHWQRIIKLVKSAALLHPQNRSIGWDVVVTKDGPGLIEGNHDWCKLLWQLPVKKGLKPMLESHKEFKNYYKTHK